MTTTTESTFKFSDGQSVYTILYDPTSQPVAELIFIHGFSDHCNAGYQHLFNILTEHKIRVFTFDQRGWGKSQLEKSKWGLSGGTAQVLKDIDEVVQSRLAVPGQVPIFLMGHSMGGGEILVFASHGPPATVNALAGFVAESPFISVSPESKPSFLKVFLGRLASKIVPNRQLYVGLDPKAVSRDPAVVQAYKDDPLTNDTGTLEGLSGMLDRAADLDGGRAVLKKDTKLWLGHGTSDEICFYPASKAWFDKSPAEDKTFRTYDGWYHKLHAEPGEDKTIFANEVAEWCLARTGRDSKL